MEAHLFALQNRIFVAVVFVVGGGGVLCVVASVLVILVVFVLVVLADIVVELTDPSSYQITCVHSHLPD